MRILNEQDEEIQESDVDTSKGRLQPEQLFVAHHDAIEHKDAVTHFAVQTFYFDDNTSLEVTDENDPHVDVVDAKTGVFNYIDQGEGKVLRGIDLRTITDEEEVEAKDEEDEYEDIQRYILYTEEELAAMEASREKSQKQQAFLENGPAQLDSNTTSIEDLTILMSDIIGGAE